MELLAGDGLWSVAIFTAIFLLLVDLMHQRQRRTACYPPGPVIVPVLGNLLQLDFQNIQYSMYKVRETVIESGRGHGHPSSIWWCWSHRLDRAGPLGGKPKRLPGWEDASGPKDTVDF